MQASRKREMEANKKEPTKEKVRKCESSKEDGGTPILKTNVAKLNASEREKSNTPARSQKQKDESETESYCGSSCFMSRLDDDASINLLASDNKKENKEKSQKQKSTGDKKDTKP
jgi:hypothetical protein